MTTGTFRKTTSKTAAVVALGLMTTGAFAQTVAVPSAVEPYAGPSRIDVREVAPQARPLTVMGMTGGIEAKDVESTGSLGIRPERPQWLRLR